MEALTVAINAVVPYLIYLSLGYLFKKWKIIEEEFYLKLNQIIFMAFYPITMFYNTHSISVSFSESALLIGVCAALLAAVILVSVIVVPMLEKDNRRRGVIIQCLNRSNIVLYALGMAESLFGSEGVALASVIVAIFVPVYNIAAIIVLEYYGGGKPNAKALFLKVIKNPLFLGAAVGLVFSAIGLKLPACIESTVSKLSALTTPLAMMILGGTMHAASIRKNMKCIVSTLAAKMILIPAAAVAVCALMRMPALETFIVFIVFGTPISANAYTMSQNMGGDGELAGELVAMSTILSLFTLFGWIFLLRTMALI